MKKLIAFLTAVLLCVQGIGFAEAAEAAEEGFAERLAALCAVEVLVNENAEPETIVSRGEFISDVLRFTNEYFDAIKVNSVRFLDVDQDHPYAGPIERAAELGYMMGYTDGCFYPDSPIVLEQAVKVLVNALGYQIRAEERGGYPSGYLRVASSLDILEGVEQSSGETLRMDSLVTMLYNACECPVQQKDRLSAQEESYHLVEEGPALYMFHSTACVEGVVTANQVTGLKRQEDGQRENYVILNDEMMRAGITEAEKWLGYTVKAYVHYDDRNSEGEIVYITPSARNQVLTVKAKDIIRDDAQFDGATFVYQTPKGTKRAIGIGADTSVLYNGVAKPLYSVQDLMAEIGDVTFIDNNGDGKYDCVSIFHVDRVIVPEFISDASGEYKLVDLFDSANTYTYSADYKGYQVEIDGETNLYTAIKADMLVMIGTNGEHSVTRAYSDGVKIPGVVKLESQENVVINDTAYEYSPWLDKDTLALNGIGYFWIYDGTVFAYKKDTVEINGEAVAPDRYSYGFMIEASYQSNGIEPELDLRVLTTESEIEGYGTTKDTRYNGKKMSRDKAAMLFASSASGGSYIWKPQLIMYKLDADKNLKEVYTVADAAVSPDSKLRYEGSFSSGIRRDEQNRSMIDITKGGQTISIPNLDYASYTFYIDTWLNVFYQDTDTVVFHINDSDLESSYATGAFPSAETINEGKFIHEFYNIDEDLNTVDVVVWHSDIAQGRQQIAKGALPVVVTAVSEVIDSEGDISQQIEGIMNKAEVAIPYNDEMSDELKEIFNSIKPGDIVFYQLDGKGRLEQIEKSFDSTKIGQYGMSNLTKFDDVHAGWSQPVHLYRKVEYVKIKEKLHNNFYSYVVPGDNGAEIVSVQNVDPAASFYRMTLRNGTVLLEPITYSDVTEGNDIYAMFEFNRLKVMIVIEQM